MPTIAIQAEGLGKKYRVGAQRDRYKTLRETVMGAPQRIRRRHAADEFWALRDVDLEVQQGEALGLIGRNGAGKSTLLKILARITEPTTGFAEINGRVGSLLEVGSGFNMEFTGRENVYLNGAILGMRRREIDRKFDEIVEFAETGLFVDTPVKRYSSGMYMRLAFAVAAHLEPEILLVDEVLAVGDAEFQARCLTKMGDVANRGRTVIFVSHNLAAVNQLCGRALLLERGSIAAEGDPASVVNRYLSISSSDRSGEFDLGEALRSGDGGAKISRFSIRVDGRCTSDVGIAEPVEFHATIEPAVPLPNLVWGVELLNSTGLPIANLRSDAEGVVIPGSGPIEVSLSLDGLPLSPGLYRLEPWVATHHGSRLDQIHDTITLTIISKGRYRAEKMIQPGRAVIVLDGEWRCHPMATGT